MKTLKEIQQGLQDSLTGKDQRISDIIVEPEGMTVEDRLRVYHNDYYLRLLDALKDDYDCLSQHIGDEQFNLIVGDYLNTYPSTTFTIREIGLDLPKFLKERETDPALVELAEFEAAMIISLFSKDADILDLETLGKIPPEQWGELKLNLHPSLRTLHCQYNILDFWLAYDEEKPIELMLLDEPVLVLVWRYENEAYFRSLTSEQAILFNSIADGEIFADLCETMLEHFDEEEVVQWVAGTLQAWIGDGIFSGYQLS